LNKLDYTAVQIKSSESSQTRSITPYFFFFFAAGFAFAGLFAFGGDFTTTFFAMTCSGKCDQVK